MSIRWFLLLLLIPVSPAGAKDLTVGALSLSQLMDAPVIPQNGGAQSVTIRFTGIRFTLYSSPARTSVLLSGRTQVGRLRGNLSAESLDIPPRGLELVLEIEQAPQLSMFRGSPAMAGQIVRIANIEALHFDGQSSSGVLRFEMDELNVKDAELTFQEGAAGWRLNLKGSERVTATVDVNTGALRMTSGHLLGEGSKLSAGSAPLVLGDLTLSAAEVSFDRISVVAENAITTVVLTGLCVEKPRTSWLAMGGTQSALEAVQQVCVAQITSTHPSQEESISISERVISGLRVTPSAAAALQLINAVSYGSAPGTTIIPFGVEEVPYVRVGVLVELYRALAQAEDDPKRFYSSFLMIDGDVLAEVQTVSLPREQGRTSSMTLQVPSEKELPIPDVCIFVGKRAGWVSSALVQTTIVAALVYPILVSSGVTLGAAEFAGQLAPSLGTPLFWGLALTVAYVGFVELPNQFGDFVQNWTQKGCASLVEQGAFGGTGAVTNAIQGQELTEAELRRLYGTAPRDSDQRVHAKRVSTEWEVLKEHSDRRRQFRSGLASKEAVWANYQSDKVQDLVTREKELTAARVKVYESEMSRNREVSEEEEQYWRSIEAGKIKEFNGGFNDRTPMPGTYYWAPGSGGTSGHGSSSEAANCPNIYHDCFTYSQRRDE